MLQRQLPHLSEFTLKRLPQIVIKTFPRLSKIIGVGSLALACNIALAAPSSTVPDEFVEMNISSTQATKQGFYQLTLLTPTPDMLYRRPAQTIDISFTVTPALKKGDSVLLEIDGNPQKNLTPQQTPEQNGVKFDYQIPSLDVTPDKHTLTVKVINVINQPITTLDTTFYVIQNNALIQKQRQLKKQQAAYDALPWYDKIKLRIGIKDKQDSNGLNPSNKK